jgi:hypothetical protein
MDPYDNLLLTFLFVDRERFGVTEDVIDVSGVKERRASERQIIESLLKQVAGLEQEKVSFKLQVFINKIIFLLYSYQNY